MQFQFRATPSRREFMRKYATKCLSPCSSASALLHAFIGFVPIVDWIRNYSICNYLIGDIIGGLTIGCMNIPQGKQ
jgi:hypothetical protein